MQTSWRMSIAVLGLLWIGGFVACGDDSEDGSGSDLQVEKPNITIAVGGKSLFTYLPLSVAERLDYFADEGLDVEIADVAGGTVALQALLNGTADIVSGGYEHTIVMLARDQPIKAVALQARYTSIVLILPKDRAAEYESPKDLRGLTIGVTAPGSSTNMFVNNLLAKDGLRPTDVSIVGVGATSGAVAAMENGEIDALANLDPVITRLESTGRFVAVADGRTEEGMEEIYGGEYHASAIYLTEEFIRDYPNTVQAVVNAIVRANRWIAKASAPQIVALMPSEYMAGNPSLYEEALIKNLDAYSEDGMLSIEAAENVYRVLVQFEPSVKAAGTLDLSRTFDNTFARRAAAKYQSVIGEDVGHFASYLNGRARDVP